MTWICDVCLDYYRKQVGGVEVKSVARITGDCEICGIHISFDIPATRGVLNYINMPEEDLRLVVTKLGRVNP